jgi:citronellol/citronellal dehydrogenase
LKGIAVNALWPKTIIFTAALQAIDKSIIDLMRRQARKPDIVADAAYVMINQNSRKFSGNFCIDEDILKYQGIANFDHYSVTPGSTELASGIVIWPIESNPNKKFRWLHRTRL